MQTPDAMEELYLNLRAIRSPDTIDIHIGDWVTDAYLLHFRRAISDDQRVERFFLGDGSYLRHKRRSMIESLSKLTACWAPGDALEIFSNNASGSIKVAAEAPPRSVRWNNRPVPGKYDDKSRLVSLHI